MKSLRPSLRNATASPSSLCPFVPFSRKGVKWSLRGVANALDNGFGSTIRSSTTSSDSKSGSLRSRWMASPR